MRRSLSLAVLVAGLLTVGAVSAAQPAAVPDDLGQRLVATYAAPATQRLDADARALAQALASLCKQPAAKEAEAVESRFRSVVLAWSGVEFLRFGPLVEGNRYERIAFWPDPRGVMSRQVQGLLADPAVTALDAQALSARSVAQQGLPALEFVLYRDGGVLDAARQGRAEAPECAYAQAAAGALALQTGALAQAWSAQGEYARRFSRPAADNPLYRTPREVAAEAIKALSTGLQFARDVKLVPALAEPYQDSRARRAPYWRSGLTAPALAASVESMLRFHDAAGWALPAEEAWRVEGLRRELVQLRDVLSSLEAPVGDLLQDPEGRRQLTLATLLLKNAKDLLDQDLAPQLGVTIGFNALDGD